MLRHLPLLPLVLIGVIGCSSTDPEPAQPPDVMGQYAGTFALNILRSDGLEGAISCDCTVNIRSQTGTRFSGGADFAGGPCGTGTAPFSGTVEVDGTIELGFGYSLLRDCTKRVAPPLTGTYSGGTISAGTTEEYDCADGDIQATVEVQLTATRQ